MPLLALLLAFSAPCRAQEASTETLEHLRDPSEMKRYTDQSRRLEPFSPDVPGGAVQAEAGAGEDPDGSQAREVATAAGLSVLERLRPQQGSYSPPRKEKKDSGPAIEPASPNRATLEDIGARSYGRYLLEGITDEDWSALDVRTRSGAILTVEYGDLAAGRERGEADVFPKQGRYKVVIDRLLQGTEAELAIKAHELSHVRDAEELPDAKKEWLGLLMEYRANLYEIATYLEHHRDIRSEAPPRNFYDAEVWFKARVFAGGLDQAFVEKIPSSGPWGQVRARAGRIVEQCVKARAEHCGGTEALHRWVVDPIYAETDEGNILLWDTLEFEDAEFAGRDQALAYMAETDALENRVRTNFGVWP
jgi:hypothetical protein